MIFYLCGLLILAVAMLTTLDLMFGLTAGFVKLMGRWQSKHQQWLAHTVDIEVRDEGGYQVAL